jgi:hypothetical protein
MPVAMRGHPFGASQMTLPEDAVIGSLVVLFLGPRDLGLDVERKRLDRAGEVVLGHLSTVMFARNPCAIDVFRYRTD